MLALTFAVVSEVFSANSPSTEVIGPGNSTVTLMSPMPTSPSMACISASSALWPSLVIVKTMFDPSLVICHRSSGLLKVAFAKLQV